MFGANDAAETRSSLDEHERHSLTLQLVRGSEPTDAAADNYTIDSHPASPEASAVPTRRAQFRRALQLHKGGR